MKIKNKESDSVNTKFNSNPNLSGQIENQIETTKLTADRDLLAPCKCGNEIEYGETLLPQDKKANEKPREQFDNMVRRTMQEKLQDTKSNGFIVATGKSAKWLIDIDGTARG